MSEEDTLPNGFDERMWVLWQNVLELKEQNAVLFRQNWIREQEVLSLKYEVYALRLRILELEEKKG